MRTHVAVLSGVFLAASGALAAAEDREVPAFDSVHVASGIRATIAVGARKPVHLEADKDVLEAIETRVEDGTLHVGFKPRSRIWNTGEVMVSIQTPELHAVAGSGGSVVRATAQRRRAGQRRIGGRAARQRKGAGRPVGRVGDARPRRGAGERGHFGRVGSERGRLAAAG